MKIVEPSATVEWSTPYALATIERAGRTCYKSEPQGDPEKFIRRLIKSGHESVLEHASASFRIVCDRGISHELVRHRIASFSQESTRYCKYADGIHVIMPSGMNNEIEGHWRHATTNAEISYLSMLSAGASPQVARSVLPACTATEIVMTANFREWRTVLRQRTAMAAHPDMRIVARMILAWFRANFPVIVEDIQA